MTSLGERIAPARLGLPFRWVLASSWVANLSDGFAMAAGPLLVASRTHDPLLIALAALLQWLPAFMFGLAAGALSDRSDRRRLLIAANLARVLVLALLSAAVLAQVASVPLVLVALFVLSTTDVFADNTTSTLLPMLLDRDDLAVGNSRTMFGVITLHQLIGPPVGAALFAVGAAWPFIGQGILALAAAILFSRAVLPPHGLPLGQRGRMRTDIVEGIRWVRAHAAVRTLVLTIFAFNITFGAAWSVLVLYSRERLGLGAVGFGLITTAAAVGGLLGTVAYGWITSHVSLGNLMRIGLIVETFTHLALALTTHAAIALSIFVLFGAHSYIWGTTSVTVRQRAVPQHLQGRVDSVNLIGVYAGLVAGAGIGGVLARIGNVTTPFWFAFVGSAIFVVLIWGQLRHVAHQDSHVIAE